jgi:type III restriction enzyme
LNYFIGWDEKNFAEKLVGEINSDAKIILNHETLTEEMIQAITSYRNINKEKLLETLDKKDIIKRNNDFKEGGYEKLLAEYPELLQTQLHQNKVRNNNQNKRQTIKLRVGNWEKIAGFWEQVSKRYMLKLERLKQNEMETLVDDVLKENIFSNNPISIIKESTAKGDDGNVKLNKGRMIADHQTNIGQLQYGEFIKKLHKRTFIPVHLIHKKISAKLSELPNDKIVTLLNEDSLNQFVRNFKDKFRETFATKYKYTSLDFTAETNIKKNGSFVEELKRGSVGNNDAPDIKDDERNLYEIPLSYDSEIEHDVLKVIPPDHVIVYGKLPRQSIKLPTYTGGTTTPDFVYAVHKKSSDQIELHLVVEIKSENPHTSDKIVTESQKKAFETIGGNIQWRMDISVAEFEKALKNLAGKAPHKNQRPERAME